MSILKESVRKEASSQGEAPISMHAACRGSRPAGAPGRSEKPMLPNGPAGRAKPWKVPGSRLPALLQLAHAALPPGCSLCHEVGRQERAWPAELGRLTTTLTSRSWQKQPGRVGPSPSALGAPQAVKYHDLLQPWNAGPEDLKRAGARTSVVSGDPSTRPLVSVCESPTRACGPCLPQVPTLIPCQSQGAPPLQPLGPAPVFSNQTWTHLHSRTSLTEAHNCAAYFNL